ncbi:MAG: RNA methyltransferase [Anaerolineae bacterium]|nr:RNA methyltransferase [Anaerolineae bacterium]
MLTSLANERVRYARSLQRERVRNREQRFTIEGTRLIEEALRAGARPVLAFYTERLTATARGRALLDALRQASESVMEVSEQVMRALSATVTPQGAFAVVPMPALPWPDRGLVLVLDGLQDPGNAGTILRTAWAAGARALATTGGTVDLYAPKVVRSAMGAHFHLPLRVDLDLEGLTEALRGRRILLADQHGKPYWDTDWRGDCALIIGGEARGPQVAGSLAAEHVGIPMAGGVESLNAAIAAAVLLFEAYRQREQGRTDPSP